MLIATSQVMLATCRFVFTIGQPSDSMLPIYCNSFLGFMIVWMELVIVCPFLNMSNATTSTSICSNLIMSIPPRILEAHVMLFFKMSTMWIISTLNFDVTFWKKLWTCMGLCAHHCSKNCVHGFVIFFHLLEELGTCHYLRKFYVHGGIIISLVSICFFLSLIFKVLGYVDIFWVFNILKESLHLNS